MKNSRQTTLRKPVHLQGIGVHSGQACSVTIHPAGAGHGRTVMRSDQDFSETAALSHNVTSMDLSTVVGDPERGGVATVEHVLSALNGLGVDNAIIEVDGPEMPILDGSAAEIVRAIDAVGVIQLAAKRRFIKVLRPVRVRNGESYAEIVPADEGFRVSVEIDFASSVIGVQKRSMLCEPMRYRNEVAEARTFGFMADVEMLWANRMALGASLDNTVVVGDEKVMNPEGLRFADEFVRHKMLDAIGDLALAGLPLIGAFTSQRGGHRLNVALVEALLADSANYAIVEDMVPARTVGHAAVHGMAAAAYKADAS